MPFDRSASAMRTVVAKYDFSDDRIDVTEYHSRFGSDQWQRRPEWANNFRRTVRDVIQTCSSCCESRAVRSLHLIR
jgi:hypothetical protein